MAPKKATEKKAPKAKAKAAAEKVEKEVPAGDVEMKEEETASAHNSTSSDEVRGPVEDNPDTRGESIAKGTKRATTCARLKINLVAGTQRHAHDIKRRKRVGGAPSVKNLSTGRQKWDLSSGPDGYLAAGGKNRGMTGSRYCSKKKNIDLDDEAEDAGPDIDALPGTVRAACVVSRSDPAHDVGTDSSTVKKIIAYDVTPDIADGGSIMRTVAGKKITVKAKKEEEGGSQERWSWEPHDIASRLGTWYMAHRRKLPWHGSSWYGVWISEVMLQQTQVAKVIPYWEQWMSRWPSVAHLREATQEQVFELWMGLGYYRRAKNLLEAAQSIPVKDEEGINVIQEPTCAEDLRELKGVGRYTANAVASIAFHEKVPVVDCNVERVLARCFYKRLEEPDIHSASTPVNAKRTPSTSSSSPHVAPSKRPRVIDLCSPTFLRRPRGLPEACHQPTDSPDGPKDEKSHDDNKKKHEGARKKNKNSTEWMWGVMGELVRNEPAGVINQAMMELGATLCSIRDPKCWQCPIRPFCNASIEGDPGSDIVKVKKPEKPCEEMDLYVVEVTPPVHSPAFPSSISSSFRNGRGKDGLKEVKKEEDVDVGVPGAHGKEEGKKGKRGRRLAVAKFEEGGLLGGQWMFPPADVCEAAFGSSFFHDHFLPRRSFKGTIRHEFSHRRHIYHVYTAHLLEHEEAQMNRIGIESGSTSNHHLEVKQEDQSCGKHKGTRMKKKSRDCGHECRSPSRISSSGGSKKVTFMHESVLKGRLTTGQKKVLLLAAS